MWREAGSQLLLLLQRQRRDVEARLRDALAALLLCGSRRENNDVDGTAC